MGQTFSKMVKIEEQSFQSLNVGSVNLEQIGSKCEDEAEPFY